MLIKIELQIIIETMLKKTIRSMDFSQSMCENWLIYYLVWNNQKESGNSKEAFFLVSPSFNIVNNSREWLNVQLFTKLCFLNGTKTE